MDQVVMRLHHYALNVKTRNCARHINYLISRHFTAVLSVVLLSYSSLHGLACIVIILL